ncbi:glycosyltransferase [Lacticaseibacillus parakribbianus]|uniref:glycosyltransferase n=1 Tax=Lacticaseibacillus parakribbianus TaxID=2970927 RepID=UPI0021CB54AF|nr:glycosyltransferase family 2 protein [Lacticaseibacillus parakribbianus]
MFHLMILFVAGLATFNFARIFTSLAVANFAKAKKLRAAKRQPVPTAGIAVVIPAYNEEKDIEKCVRSVVANTYPHKQVIVVDDGSTDATDAVLDRLAQEFADLVVVHQPNAGKARALNNGIMNYADYELVMVLDGDSALAPGALAAMVAHFEADPTLIAAATNVVIEAAHNVIEYTQKLEYLIGNKYKEAEPALNLEYIVGGIGSTFRKSALQEVGGYSTDSITEDIDLSMKLIHHFGNQRYHIDYTDDVVCYTPAAHSFADLKTQRLRWKYGRFKALAKNRRLFFSRDFAKYSPTLTWWKLPKIVFFEELMMLLEPVFLCLMAYLLYLYSDLTTMSGTAIVYALVAFTAIFADAHLPRRERLQLLVTAPFTICLLYIVNVVDFVSLIKCLGKSREIVLNTNQTSAWEHIER